MDFIVFLSVFAIAITQVIARPADMEDSRTKDRYTRKADYLESFKFKLPKTVQHDHDMIINGILDISHKNFNAMLIEEFDENVSCKISFNYQNNNALEVLSALDKTTNTDLYSIDETLLKNSEAKELEFKLYLQARENSGSKMIELQFEEVNSGPSPMVLCEINSFEKLSHIVFKEGVKKIKSMTFNF